MPWLFIQPMSNTAILETKPSKTLHKTLHTVNCVWYFLFTTEPNLGRGGGKHVENWIWSVPKAVLNIHTSLLLFYPLFFIPISWGMAWQIHQFKRKTFLPADRKSHNVKVTQLQNWKCGKRFDLHQSWWRHLKAFFVLCILISLTGGLIDLGKIY